MQYLLASLRLAFIGIFHQVQLRQAHAAGAAGIPLDTSPTNRQTQAINGHAELSNNIVIS